MADFDVFSLLEFRKHKSRSHGLRQKGNKRRKMFAVNRTNTSLKDLLQELKGTSRYSLLSFLKGYYTVFQYALESLEITGIVLS